MKVECVKEINLARFVLRTMDKYKFKSTLQKTLKEDSELIIGMATLEAVS